MNTISYAIKTLGVDKVSSVCGVSERAVYKWLKNGCLPRTEFFGKTNYAKAIEVLSEGKFKARQLLEMSKKKHLEG